MLTTLYVTRIPRSVISGTHTIQHITSVCDSYSLGHSTKPFTFGPSVLKAPKTKSWKNPRPTTTSLFVYRELFGGWLNLHSRLKNLSIRFTVPVPARRNLCCGCSRLPLLLYWPTRRAIRFGGQLEPTLWAHCFCRLYCFLCFN